MKKNLVFLVVFSIFVAINIGSIKGSADDTKYEYSHSITGTSVAEGTVATDIVNTKPLKANFAGTNMRFEWNDPRDKHRRVAIVPLNKQKDTYTDRFLIPPIIGKWEIETEELRRIGNRNKWIKIGESETTFTVIQVPEFGKFGQVIPLFLMGIFYMRLRKNIPK